MGYFCLACYTDLLIRRIRSARKEKRRSSVSTHCVESSGRHEESRLYTAPSPTVLTRSDAKKLLFVFKAEYLRENANFPLMRLSYAQQMVGWKNRKKYSCTMESVCTLEKRWLSLNQLQRSSEIMTKTDNFCSLNYVAFDVKLRTF